MATNNKKRNAYKLRVIKNAQTILNDFSIVHTYHSKTGKNAVLYSRNNQVNLTQSIAQALETIRCKWDVTCGVLCRNKQNNHYALFSDVRAEKECISEDLGNIVQDICSQMFDEAPEDEKLCPFWIATPRSNNGVNNLELVLKTAFKFNIFNELGTNYEINNNLPVIDFSDYNKVTTDFKWECVKLDLSQWQDSGISH